MNRYVAYGVESKKVITTGTEAEIHQYFSIHFFSFSKLKPIAWVLTIKVLMDPIYPETLRIEKAEEYYDDLD